MRNTRNIRDTRNIKNIKNINITEVIKKTKIAKVESKKTLKILLLGIVIPTFLSGCMGINSRFDCNVSSGGKCVPMDSIHKMADRGEFNAKTRPIYRTTRYNNITKARRSTRGNRNNSGIKYQKHPLNSFSSFTSLSNHPPRESEAIQKIWIGPYEDANDNYHEPSYIYSVIKKGRWLTESEKNYK